MVLRPNFFCFDAVSGGLRHCIPRAAFAASYASGSIPAASDFRAGISVFKESIHAFSEETAGGSGHVSFGCRPLRRPGDAGLAARPAIARPGNPNPSQPGDLFATVRDKNKRIVTDLKQQDFKLQEDGQDQTIAFLPKEVTMPITLALLLDTSGSEQFMLGAIQDIGGRFLDRVLRRAMKHCLCRSIPTVDLLSDFHR